MIRPPHSEAWLEAAVTTRPLHSAGEISPVTTVTRVKTANTARAFKMGIDMMNSEVHLGEGGGREKGEYAPSASEPDRQCTPIGFGS